MKISLFELSLVFIIIGTVWIAFVFLQGNRVSEEILLKPSNSHDIQLNLEGADVGFYKITILEFAGEQVFVQILEKNHNIISEQNIQTKMSIGYFDFVKSGTFTAKITNLSKNQINVQVELGNTNSKNMILPGIMIFTGAMMIIVILYLKLRNYNIAQPDENIL